MPSLSNLLFDAEQMAHELQQERDQYKRLWELRGQALKRGCPNCDHIQAEIRAQGEKKFGRGVAKAGRQRGTFAAMGQMGKTQEKVK